MCHVSFNLVGIHRPAADRLPSLLARKERGWEAGGGGSRHHAAHLGIASESSSSRPPASMCVCVCARVWMYSTHICVTSRIGLRQTFVIHLKETPRTKWNGKVSISYLTLGNLSFSFLAATHQAGWDFICELLCQSQLGFCFFVFFTVVNL